MSKITLTQPGGSLVTFRHWLSRLPVSHPFERRQALALQTALLVLIGTNLVMTPLTLLNATPRSVPAVLLSNVVIVGLFATALVLLRRGRLQPAALIASSSIIMVIGGMLPLVGLTAGGSVLVLLVMAIVLAALLLRGRALLVLVGLSCVLVGLTAVLENAGLPPVGLLPPVKNIPLTYATVTVATLIILGLLVGSFSRALSQAIEESLRVQGELESVRAAQAATIAQQTEELREALYQAELREVHLAAALGELQQSQATVRALSAPAIPVLPGVLIVPLIGALDADLAGLFSGTVLVAVERRRARQVLLDITGVAMLDQTAAQQVLQLGLAVRLLGARLWLVGVRPEVAQALVSLGVSLNDIPTSPDLESAVVRLNRELKTEN